VENSNIIEIKEGERGVWSERKRNF
jgi:hypothetical protein